MGYLWNLCLKIKECIHYKRKRVIAKLCLQFLLQISRKDLAGRVWVLADSRISHLPPHTLKHRAFLCAIWGARQTTLPLSSTTSQISSSSSSCHCGQWRHSHLPLYASICSLTSNKEPDVELHPNKPTCFKDIMPTWGKCRFPLHQQPPHWHQALMQRDALLHWNWRGWAATPPSATYHWWRNRDVCSSDNTGRTKKTWECNEEIRNRLSLPL